MLILWTADPGGACRTVLLFGVGQIGFYIVQGLQKHGFVQREEQPFSWSDPQLQSQQADRIRQQLPIDLAGPVSFIWSAGVCGFHSSDEDVAQEFDSFERVLQLYRDVHEDHPDARLDFHLVSSAGGLFEGQTVIGPASRPTPRRPYGHLKLRQERAARESVGGAGLVIYRPSSVYGPMVQDVHRGLINNLVKNARNGRFTVLDSQVMSLRDYVYAGDIGHYVARQVVEGSAGGEGGVRFLISGRCSPIFEVVRKIQRLLHLNVYYRLDDRFGNHGHITFNPDLMPRGWRPVTLDYGISRFARVD